MSSFDGIPYARYLDTSIGRCSIDNLRVKFTYKLSVYNWSKGCSVPSIDFISNLVDVFDLTTAFGEVNISWSYKDFFKIGAYVRTASISGLDWSCAVLIGRYCFDDSCKLIAPEAVFDFNPNKVPSSVLQRIFTMLQGPAVEVKVLRYDVAFDIPMSREDVFLVRGDTRRSYRLFLDGGSKTEYLGARSSHGSLKLYDKTKESELSVPVTRAEITVEAVSFSSIRDVFPSLYAYHGYQLDVSFSSLPFQVQVCILNPEFIPLLRASCCPHTYRKYMSQIDSFSGCALLPDNFEQIDRFIQSSLMAYMEVVF